MLAKYQDSINKVAMELCLQNPNLLNDRKELLEASRKKLDEAGYAYKKGKSLSKLFFSDDGEQPVKRVKSNKDFRLSRISQLQEEIKDKTEQREYKAVAGQKYSL